MQQLIDIASQFIIRAQTQLDDVPLNGSGIKWIHNEHPNQDLNIALELAKSVIEPLPEMGNTDFEGLLSRVFNQLAPCSTHDNSGGYLAYIPSGGLFHAALADFIALSLNRYITIFMAAPAFAMIENQVVRWLCDIIGFSSSAGGMLSSGGSLATMTAIHTARTQRLNPQDTQKGIIYVSEQAHHCIEQGCLFCGFPAQNIRKIATNANFKISIKQLKKQIIKDKKAGLHPFLLVANAGTTNTGAVDNLIKMEEIARKHQLWFHIDAAYGGFFMLTKKGQSRLKGIEKADSIVLDPHKGLFLPYGTGALLVKQQSTLTQTFNFTASYLPTETHQQQSNLSEDIMHLSPELTRDFRGFRFWLPLKMLGIDVFRQQLNDKLNLTQWMSKKIAKIPHIQIIASPQLSIFVFKLYPLNTSISPQALDELNINLLDKINQQGRILLSPFKSKKAGDFAIRIAILSFRTNKQHLKQGLIDIKHAVSEIMKSLGTSGYVRK
jgi:aromatic-L-amino-acid decarboxylase